MRKPAAHHESQDANCDSDLRGSRAPLANTLAALGSAALAQTRGIRSGRATTARCSALSCSGLGATKIPQESTELIGASKSLFSHVLGMFLPILFGNLLLQLEIVSPHIRAILAADFQRNCQAFRRIAPDFISHEALPSQSGYRQQRCDSHRIPISVRPASRIGNDAVPLTMPAA